jgi:hypothetical protein
MHVELTVGQDGAVSRESYFNGNDLFLSGPKVSDLSLAGNLYMLLTFPRVAFTECL